MESREFYRALGASLAQRRQDKHLTQAELARRLGMTRAGLANVETGRQGVHVHQLVEIANALGVSSLETILPATFWVRREASAAARVTVTGSQLNDEQIAQVSKIVEMLGEAE